MIASQAASYCRNRDRFVKIAFISDIHSNLQALDAVLGHLEREAVDAIYCLGDIVGYNANPVECLNRVRRTCAAVVMGNHDYAVAKDDFTSFNALAKAGAQHSLRSLDRSGLDYLANLPLTRDVHAGDTTITICHGSPDDPLWEYVFPQHATDLLETAALGHLEEETCLLALGHTHLPMLARTAPGERAAPLIVMNPGSVGQPRDGDARASCAVYDTEVGDVIFHRVAYDVKAAHDANLRAGLPAALGERLHAGR